MRNILKYRRDFLLAKLLSKEQILYLLYASIDEVVPRTRITIQHGRCLEELLAVRLAAFTFKSIMRIRRRLALVHKQLLQRIQGEMPLHVFSGIDNTGGERLLVGLTLEDLLFDCAGGDEAVDEAVFLLSVAPDSSQSLLIGGGVPIWVEEDEAICSNKVQAAASGL